MNKIQDKFIEWLKNDIKEDGEPYSPRSVEKYESAVRVTSELMLHKGVIKKDIYNMTRSEYKTVINDILNDRDFIKKNETGNSMYSLGLKKYSDFLDDNNDKSLDAYKKLYEENMKLREEIKHLRAENMFLRSLHK